MVEYTQEKIKLFLLEVAADPEAAFPQHRAASKRREYRNEPWRQAAMSRLFVRKVWRFRHSTHERKRRLLCSIRSQAPLNAAVNTMQL